MLADDQIKQAPPESATARIKRAGVQDTRPPIPKIRSFLVSKPETGLFCVASIIRQDKRNGFPEEDPAGRVWDEWFSTFT